MSALAQVAIRSGRGLRGAGAALVLAACLSAPLSGAFAQANIRKVGGSVPVAIDVPTARAGSGAPAAEAAPPAQVDRGPPGERATLAVTVDRAKIIRLPEKTQTVVIGNPAIADLSIQKNGIVVVTGKSYGITNVIAIDSVGNVLAESVVSVSAPVDSIVTVQRGDQRQSYSCNPACQPSIQLGDSTTYFTDNKTQAETRSQFAVSR